MKSYSINLLIMASVLLILMPLCSAQLIYELGTEVDLKVPCLNNNTYCSGSSVCNLTVFSPESSIVLNNKQMTNSGAYHNYTLSTSETNDEGYHLATMVCIDGGNTGSTTFEYEITVNGREKPSGIVIVIFSILFLIIIGSLFYLIFYSIGHFITLDFDLRDAIYNYTAYFLLLAIYMFGKEYLGSAIFNDWMVWVIGVTGLTNIFLPTVAFILSITLGAWRGISPQSEGEVKYY